MLKIDNINYVDLTSADIEVDDDSKSVLDSVIGDIVDIGYEASLT